MKQLTNAAILRAPISETDVEEIWTRVKAQGTESLTTETIRILCESHERLRMDLQGAEATMEVTYRKIAHGCVDANCSICDQGESA